MKTSVLPDRFKTRVKVTAKDCWNWLGGINNCGYGVTNWKGAGRGAHRAIYEVVVGDIPEGMQLDHLCHNKRCVNPDHMEVVTQKENNLRGDSIGARNSRKTHCMRGHEFNEKNTYINVDGARECRACWPFRGKIYRERRKARLAAGRIT